MNIPENTPDYVARALQKIISNMTSGTQRGILYRPCDVPEGMDILDCVIILGKT